jgi:hypothetical protein
METQANEQAPAQAQTPVHPIHEETATLNALTKWVSESSDNDPHSGTDLQAPPQEAPAEAPAEEVKAEEKPEEEVIEFDEETPFFDLEYNGKKEKLSAKQLREGYLAKADYHRNIQKVKAEEAALQDRLKAETLKAQQEYVQRLETHKQAVTKLAGVKSMQEIEQLSREDPAAAQQEFLRLISVNQTMQSIETEQRQAAEDLRTQQQAAMKPWKATLRALRRCTRRSWRPYRKSMASTPRMSRRCMTQELSRFSTTLTYTGSSNKPSQRLVSESWQFPRL